MRGFYLRLVICGFMGGGNNEVTFARRGRARPGMKRGPYGRKNLVEPMGFEPTTSSMPSRRAPNCATAPPSKNYRYFYITGIRSGSNFLVFLDLASIIFAASRLQCLCAWGFL